MFLKFKTYKRHEKSYKNDIKLNIYHVRSNQNEIKISYSDSTQFFGLGHIFVNVQLFVCP